MLLNDRRQNVIASSIESPRTCGTAYGSEPGETLSITHLEEQTILQSPEVLEMLVSPETLVQVAHARGEMFLRHVVDHVRGYFVAVARRRRTPF